MAAQRGGQRREQLVGRELGLGLVVVDVVIDDDAPLRRLARLAGAQDDAHRLVLELLADELHQAEPGGVALHDDVEQDDGHVGWAHELAALGGRIGRHDFEPWPVELVIAEREARAVVHRRLVVDHRDLPARRCSGEARRPDPRSAGRCRRQPWALSIIAAGCTGGESPGIRAGC